MIPCCHLHKEAGCCDPDDCGPCCENCPTCPTLGRARIREIARLRDVLEEIAHIDYRGQPHESARIARKALQS